MNLIKFSAIKQQEEPVLFDDMMNSVQAVDHSEWNFVKDVQNQLLFGRTDIAQSSCDLS